eukprot:scaffold22287_cov67-Skeletonema_dohrnii-CCMP3373.AAC.2
MRGVPCQQHMLTGRRRERAPVVAQRAHCTHAVNKPRPREIYPTGNFSSLHENNESIRAIAPHFIFLPQETSPTSTKAVFLEGTSISMMRALALVPESIENFLPPLCYYGILPWSCQQNNRDDTKEQAVVAETVLH